jgi:hypothetical protein
MTDFQDEEYDPESIQEDSAIRFRIAAADIASRLPWAASEVPTTNVILDRFDAVNNWIQTGSKETKALTD